MENPPPKIKITIELAGHPSKTLEVEDFYLIHKDGGAVDMAGVGPQSIGLLDLAFWNWKIGDQMRRMAVAQQQAKSPLIMPAGMMPRQNVR